MSLHDQRIAILGAGPIGLDAALAAQEAGLSFTVFESGPGVASSVRAWGHVRLFSPWTYDLSDRMIRALGAQLQPDECPTGAELVERVLEPVAALPFIRDRLRLNTRVVAVSRDGLLKNEEIGTGHRADHPFRILVEDHNGLERVEHADTVLDCTGTWCGPNALGDGGIPAVGERRAGDRIVRTIPDFERAPAEWAGRTSLLVGGGHSAQTVACGLARLAESHPGTRLVWALKGTRQRLDRIPDDPLPARATLTEAANHLLSGESPHVQCLFGVQVERLEPSERGFLVGLRRADATVERVDVDRIVSLTGFVGDHTLYRQLQVHECYATSGPMKLAAALLGSGSADCLSQASHGFESLLGPEPGFFILGAKSYGRNNTFLLRNGYEQVSDVFAHMRTDRSAREVARAR